MYRKSVLVTKPFKNMLEIFPTAQYHVQEAIRVLSSNRDIERIIVFGSALERKHNPWSDIDLYIEGVSRYDVHMIGCNSARSFDIITYEMLQWDEGLKNEIKKKGVIVYERESSDNSWQ